MNRLEIMDGDALRCWCHVATNALGENRAKIDALNVFPVPDGDTGTNLHRTLLSASKAIDELPAPAETDTMWRALAQGALLGACGNSGVIVSELLRGLAEICGPAPVSDGAVFGRALAHAAVLARASVGRPVEGTILTVADAAAGAAQGCGNQLADVVTAAHFGARQALARTTAQLEVLSRAGAVDAGAAGLCVLLDALAATITGSPPGRYEVPGTASQMVGIQQHSSHRYEVTFLLDAPDDAVRSLRERLDVLGDSVVAGAEGAWNVHAHVVDAGRVIEAGLQAGHAYDIQVTDLTAPTDAG
jgi:dihydroxyacetone kinase-like predicted kinase